MHTYSVKSSHLHKIERQQNSLERLMQQDTTSHKTIRRIPVKALITLMKLRTPTTNLNQLQLDHTSHCFATYGIQ